MASKTTSPVMVGLLENGICPVCKDYITQSVLSYCHLESDGDVPIVVSSKEGFLHIHDAYLTNWRHDKPLTVRRVFVRYWRNRYKRARWRVKTWRAG